MKKFTKIVAADQNYVDLLRPYVEQVLEALGYPEAWVSDLSSIWDFCADEDEREFVSNIEEALGVEIGKRDYIIDIAMKLKAMDPDG